MAADKHQPGTSGSPQKRDASPRAHAKPEWADGLRALYDSVVHEPLPDTFKDLLDRLDEPSSGGSA